MLLVAQVREKDCGGADFADSVGAALRAAKPYGVPVIVNDRVDIALAMGAHGVHVGQSDLPCDVVRSAVVLLWTGFVGILHATCSALRAIRPEGDL